MNILITFLTYRAILTKQDTDYQISIDETNRAFNLCDELEQNNGISVIGCSRNTSNAEIRFTASSLTQNDIILNVLDAISGLYKTAVAVNTNERVKELI
jgi:arginine deiminase